MRDAERTVARAIAVVRETALAQFAVIVVLGLLVTGIVVRTETRTTVTVLHNLTVPSEVRALTTVLDRFTERTGIEVDAQGTTSHREVLLGQVQSGSPPDVAILPSLGELVEHRDSGQLLRLDDVVPDGYDTPWIPPRDQRAEQGVYWIPVKATVKSLVWFDPQRYPPATRAERLARAAAEGRWCVGMGSDATSGWPGTDWVEDLLLQQSGVAVYEAWARGEQDGRWDSPQMRNAWSSWWNLLTGKGTHPERATEALANTYDEASSGLMAERPRCELDHMGSFGRTIYGSADFVPSAQLLPDADTDSAGVPAAWEVTSDYAVMFRDRPEARALIRYLASADTQRLWAQQEDTFFLSANREAATGPAEHLADPVARRLTGVLVGESTTICLDASDAMPSAMRDAFHQAVLQFLATGPDGLDRLLAQLEEIRREVRADLRGPWLSTPVCG